MARAPGRSLLLAASLAVLGVVGLTTWLAIRTRDAAAPAVDVRGAVRGAIAVDASRSAAPLAEAPAATTGSPGATLVVRLIGSEHSIALHTAHVIRAALIDESEPSAMRGEWTTAPDGYGVCRFEHLPAGIALAAGLDSKAAGLQWHLRDLMLDAGEVREVAIALVAPVRVHGRVLDGYGAPCPAVTVRLLRHVGDEATPVRYVLPDDDARTIATTLSTANGDFELTAPVAARWWIAAGGGGVRGAHPVLALARVVDIPLGVEAIEIELRIDRDLYITGRIVDPRGVPRSTKVELEPVGSRDRVEMCAAEDGTFVMGPLTPGLHRIRARHAFGFADSAWQEVVAGQSKVQLALDDGAVIRGRVAATRDGATRGTIVCAWRDDESEPHATSAASPEFTLFGLTAGSYVAVATNDDLRIAVSDPIDVQRGAHDRVELTLEAGVIVDVTAPNGEPGRVVAVDRGHPIGGARLFPLGHARLIVPARAIEIRLISRGEVVGSRVVETYGGQFVNLQITAD